MRIVKQIVKGKVNNFTTPK